MASTSDFYGESVPEALKQACRELATTQENLDISVLETGSPGIFGLCKKKAHIRVSLKNEPPPSETPTPKQAKKSPTQTASTAKKEKKPKQPSKQASTVASSKKPAVTEAKPQAPSPPSPSPKSADLGPKDIETIRGDLLQIMILMASPGKVEIGMEGEKVHCTISGDHEEVLIGPAGKTLDSLQYLVGKMAGKRLATRILFSLDAGNFREKRLEELKKQAIEYADQVKEDGKTKSIGSLNPSERRAVHLALQNDKEIRSRSVGGGLFKKVLIYPPGKGKKNAPKKKGKKTRHREAGSRDSA